MWKQESTSTVHTQRRCIQSDNRRSKLTLSNSWFGESGSVCLSTIRFPVNVYSELFGCSHCISPVRQKETQHKLHQIIKEIRNYKHKILPSTGIKCKVAPWFINYIALKCKICTSRIKQNLLQIFRNSSSRLWQTRWEGSKRRTKFGELSTLWKKIGNLQMWLWMCKRGEEITIINLVLGE